MVHEFRLQNRKNILFLFLVELHGQENEAHWLAERTKNGEENLGTIFILGSAFMPYKILYRLLIILISLQICINTLSSLGGLFDINASQIVMGYAYLRPRAYDLTPMTWCQKVR